MPKKTTKKSGTRSRGRKAEPIKFVAPTVPNDHIIRDAIALGLADSDDNSAILDILQRHPQNVDTILDEDERDERIAALVAQEKMEAEPTDADRIERVLEMVKSSSSEKGER